MRYILIMIIFTVVMLNHAYQIRSILQNEQTTAAQITQLQQENAALRQEMERMQQETSRSGNRRMMEISYYTTAADECGKDDGVTASGTKATVGRTIAAGPGIPFGTRIYITGIGERVVEDRGDFGDDHLDVLVESKEIAFRLGVQRKEVFIRR